MSSDEEIEDPFAGNEDLPFDKEDSEDEITKSSTSQVKKSQPIFDSDSEEEMQMPNFGESDEEDDKKGEKEKEKEEPKKTDQPAPTEPKKVVPIPDPSDKMSIDDLPEDIDEDEEELNNIPIFDDNDELVEFNEKLDESLNQGKEVDKNKLDQHLDLDTNTMLPKSQAQVPAAPLGPQINPNPHESFNPSSTPFEDSGTGGQIKYLTWNNIGTIRCINNSSDDKSIEIEFHDITTHHNLHLTNYENFSLGSLSNCCYVLATQNDTENAENDINEDEYEDENVLKNLKENRDKFSKARLQCTVFKQPESCPTFFTGHASKTWSVTFPKNIDIECLFVNENFICCCTSPDNLLRFWSIYGNCSYHGSIFLPGRPVTVTTTSKGDKLLVIYEKSLGVEDSYNLEVAVYERTLFPGSRSNSKFTNFKLSGKSQVPLAGTDLHKQTVPDCVSWAGFSTDTEQPFIICQESGHVMRINTHDLNSPTLSNIEYITSILTHRKNFDYNWPISIEELTAEINVITCKGNKFPTKSNNSSQVLSFFDDDLGGNVEKPSNYFVENLLCAENLGRDDLKVVQKLHCQLGYWEGLIERFVLKAAALETGSSSINSSIQFNKIAIYEHLDPEQKSGPKALNLDLNIYEKNHIQEIITTLKSKKHTAMVQLFAKLLAIESDARCYEICVKCDEITILKKLSNLARKKGRVQLYEALSCLVENLEIEEEYRNWENMRIEARAQAHLQISSRNSPNLFDEDEDENTDKAQHQPSTPIAPKPSKSAYSEFASAFSPVVNKVKDLKVRDVYRPKSISPVNLSEEENIDPMEEEGSSEENDDDEQGHVKPQPSNPFMKNDNDTKGLWVGFFFFLSHFFLSIFLHLFLHFYENEISINSDHTDQ